MCDCTSHAEPFTTARNWRNSPDPLLPNPSPIFAMTETLARLIWSLNPKSFENDGLFDAAYTWDVNSRAFCHASISSKLRNVGMKPRLKLAFQRKTRDSRPETVLSRRPAYLLAFGTLVTLVRIFYRDILVDNGAHRLNHSDGRVGLKNIPAHIDTHGAPLDGIMG